MDDPNIEKRTASSIAVNLSSYLITGSLAMIGAQAVVVTFALDKRDHLGLFYAAAVVAFASLVGSVYFGGKGISELLHDGAKGIWKTQTSNNAFNRQAIFTLLGAVLLAVSTVLGTPKEIETDMRLAQFNVELNKLQQTVAVLQQSQVGMQNDVRGLGKQVEALAAKSKTR